MNVFLKSILFLVLVTCSSSPTETNKEPDLQEVYISSGVEAYFLADLPHWINFSDWAGCQRTEPVRYMNFQTINKSFSFKYLQMVHLQHMWNKKIAAFRSSTGQTDLPPKEEAFIFNNVYAQVLGGSYDFMPPNFKNISLIWMDPFLNNPKRVKKLLERDQVQSGYPILLSNCLSTLELEELVQKYDYDEYGVKLISSEMFSIFDNQNKKMFQFGININELLPGKTITLFAPSFPQQIRGEYKKVEMK